MNNLYNQSDVKAILKRVEKLTPNAERKWGKMNVSQMLAHLNAFLEVGLNINFQKRMFIGRILGSFFRPYYVNKKQFPKNSPTGKNFIFNDKKDFENEKNKAIRLIKEFYKNGPEQCTKQPHQFFGNLTPNEWAIAQWKHFDHHLRQFNC